MDIIGIPSTANFLIVDDVENIRKFPILELKNLGFRGDIFEASSGNQAYGVLLKQFQTLKKIDFIISDYVMKDGTGMDLLKMVRGDTRFKDLPFLLLTTESEKDLVISCIKRGVSNYLLKPWLPADFHQKITYCWQKHHKIK
jgi:two-component system chemotaxis response regulator CheY